jgi:hypothetical protein
MKLIEKYEYLLMSRLFICLFEDAVIIEAVQRRITGWVMNVEQLVVWQLVGKTGVLGKYRPSANFPTKN